MYPEEEEEDQEKKKIVLFVCFFLCFDIKLIVRKQIRFFFPKKQCRSYTVSHIGSFLYLYHGHDYWHATRGSNRSAVRINNASQQIEFVHTYVFMHTHRCRI